MRESKSNFTQRTKTLKSSEPNKKYFLVCEGEKTEVIYFNQLCHECRKKNRLIEMVPIMRSFGESGWSNPKKLVDSLVRILQEEKTGFLSYETILNKMMDFLIDKNMLLSSPLPRNMIFKRLKRAVEENGFLLSGTTNEFEKICCLLVEELGGCSIETTISELKEEIIESKISFEPGFDKMCIVVDRDKNSFTKVQYENVLTVCKEQKYHFYVTNPFFEFWLLLHFEDIDALDLEKLSENPKVSKGISYIEQELKIRLPRYKKNRYNVEKLIPCVCTAIKNEKKFCEDESELEYKVGSNIGLLVEELYDRKI